MPASTTTTSTSTTDSKLLVTGASGQLGRLVVHHLLHTLHITPSRIVAGSRNPDKLKEFADLGVLTRRIDFNDAAMVEEASRDVDRALLVSSDDLFGRIETQKSTVRAFEAAGVQHVLYTSLQETDEAVALVAEDHRQTEQAIRESKIPSHTFLRNGMYFENGVGKIASACQSGQWFSAAKDGKLAAISRDDLARAAAYALADTSNNPGDNKVYELMGSEALSVDEIVAKICETLGCKPIEIVHVSTAELAKGISNITGLPEEITKVFASFDANTAEGFGATITDHYKQLTGVDPQTYGDWLVANKALLLSL
ncbi:Nucleoside-diphosphate sugar epimerase [Globisporangium polare]